MLIYSIFIRDSAMGTYSIMQTDAETVTVSMTDAKTATVFMLVPLMYPSSIILIPPVLQLHAWIPVMRIRNMDVVFTIDQGEIYITTCRAMVIFSDFSATRK
jgi:hypothetical protein